MTQIAKAGTFENVSDNQIEEAFKNSERKPRIYKITADSFAAQIKEMDHKDLIAILNQIKNELDKRTAEAEALVAELKGGKA